MASPQVLKNPHSTQFALDPRDPCCADILKQTFLFYQKDGYELLAWVIMPNHVHVMVKMSSNLTVEEMTGNWKSFAAHEINKLLNRTGALWQPDFYDRFVRDCGHFENVLRYMRKHIYTGAVLWQIPKEGELIWADVNDWWRKDGENNSGDAK